MGSEMCIRDRETGTGPEEYASVLRERLDRALSEIEALESEKRRHGKIIRDSTKEVTRLGEDKEEQARTIEKLRSGREADERIQSMQEALGRCNRNCDSLRRENQELKDEVTALRRIEARNGPR